MKKMLIEGELLKGLGKAGRAMAKCINGFTSLLGEPIFPGTFNVKAEDNIILINPTVQTDGGKFWRVKIVKPKKVNVWIYRWKGSAVPQNQLQILSQYRLRGYLGVGTHHKIIVEIDRVYIKH